MPWPSFKKLFDEGDDSVCKKRIFNVQQKRRKRITKKNKFYEPGEIHISDDSDDGKSSSFFQNENKQAKLDLDTTSTKVVRKEIDCETGVVIEWSSDEDYPRPVRKRTPRFAKLPLVLSNEKVPIKRNETVSPQKPRGLKAATITSVQAKGRNSYVIDENFATNWDTNKSGLLEPSENAEFQQIVKGDRIDAGSSNSHQNKKGLMEVAANLAEVRASTSSSSVYPNLLHADIRQRASAKKLRVKKGGYLEKMQKTAKSFESDGVFWQHNREIGLAAPGCDAVVNRVARSYGRTIFTLGIQGREVQVISFCKNLEKFLSEGLKIKVCLEGQPFHVGGTDVYLSTNKIYKT